MSGERRLTWEDIAHLPEQEMPELIDGKPYLRAAPRGRHGFCFSRLSGALDRLYNAPRSGWWVLSEPDVRLTPHRIVRPELAGWRKERMPDLTDDWPIDLRPDWVCEIASPSNAHYDRGIKSRVYLEAGVPWYWLADPQERTLEVFELQGEKWQYDGSFTDGDVCALPPFDDAVLTMAELFGPLPKGWPGA
jgi:Uma2 family endonuclease